MKNVKDLAFDIYKGTDPGIARYLLKFPLGQIFPTVVSVKFSTIDREENVERESGGDGELFPWPAVNKVRFEHSICSDLMVMELGILFPNLCCLEIAFLAENPALSSCFQFRKIWSSLPFLEKLTIAGKLAAVERNFDAEFCGLYPEEVALLQKKDEEFLKAVNIVPPFASIAHMKSECENTLLLFLTLQT